VSEGVHAPRKSRILIAGCGYVGTKLGTLLAERGDEVWGLRRNPVGLPPSIRPIAADLLDPRLGDRLPKVDRIVYATAADSSTPDGYRAAYLDGVQNLLNSIAAKEGRIDRFLFLSSTAVYGEAGGEWVDEDSPPSPESFRGEILLRSEQAVHEAIGKFGPGEAQAVVLRLGGIYGPTRTRLLERVRSGEARCREGTAEWSNRIHRDDAAGAALHLLLQPAPAPTYIGVDNEPVPLCEVYRYVARLLGVPEPEIIPPSHDAVESGASTLPERHGKRCSNRRLRETGFEFLVPTFREGYSAMIGQAGKGDE
jgi:nucleoside-diphosphate-sugar epimerase